MNSDSLRLAPVFSVGIIGHRPPQLLGAESKIEETISALLSTLCATTRRVVSSRADIYSQSPGRLMVWTSLAEGTDRIGARVALATESICVAVLPLPGHDYMTDFSEQRSRSEFETTLAASDHIIELAGSDAVRPECYGRAARVVVDNSDLIIAVWDAEWARGRGGTGESVEATLRTGKPVIIINPARPDVISVLWRGWDPYIHCDAALNSMPRWDGFAAAEEVVARLLTPPSGAAGRNLATFLAERNAQRLERQEYNAFLMVLLPRKLQGIHAKSQAIGSRETSQDSIIERWFQAATEGADFYGRRHSSQIVTKFVVVAVVSLIFGLIGYLYEAVKPTMIALQVAASAAVFIDGYLSRRGQWRRRWIEYRFLAERLRTLKFLRLVATPLPDLGWLGGQGSDSLWPEWLIHRIALSSEPLGRRLDDVGVAELRDRLLAEIELQLGYHSYNRLRFDVLDRRLSLIGSAALVATITVGVTVLLYPIVGLTLPPIATSIGGAAITLFPSLVAAIEGIRVQADFARIVERGRAIRAELVGLRAAIRNEIPTFDRLCGWSGHAAAAMAADVAQWRITIESKDRAHLG
jgi:hypothetical protein